MPQQGRFGIRRGLFHSFRFQFLFVFAVGVALPVAPIVGLPDSVTLPSAVILNSVVGAGIAALGMIISLQQIARYPSVSVVRWILPTLATYYGLILTAISLLRLDYSNSILLLSFVGTLGARYAIATLNIRGPQPSYYLVPGGRITLVHQLTDLTLVPLVEPQMPVRSNRGVAFIADLHHAHEPQWERFLAEAAIGGYSVYHCKPFWEAMSGRVQIAHLSENSFGALLPSLGYAKMKRLLDFSASLVVLPLLLLLFGLIAIAIKLDSPGPVFFRQYRMGYRGQKFRIVKFRTMTVTYDGSEANASMTDEDDARITRLGRLLRRTRLDELTQVVNILRGEMSWIGPRPEAIGLSRWYEAEIPFYLYRHIVRPGISGWAQVSQGHVTALSDVDAKLQFDFFYIKNISYWLDLLIVFKTIRTMLSGFGAR